HMLIFPPQSKSEHLPKSRVGCFLHLALPLVCPFLPISLLLAKGFLMNNELANHPQLLALLQTARQTPEDDSPRLVLADWLEEHSDAVRAEFIRLQCQLAPGAPPLESRKRKEQERRCQFLLSHHGGAWLGPLWQFWLSPLIWHRGLL